MCIAILGDLQAFEELKSNQTLHAISALEAEHFVWNLELIISSALRCKPAGPSLGVHSWPEIASFFYFRNICLPGTTDRNSKIQLCTRILWSTVVYLTIYRFFLIHPRWLGFFHSTAWLEKTLPQKIVCPPKPFQIRLCAKFHLLGCGGDLLDLCQHAQCATPVGQPNDRARVTELSQIVWDGEGKFLISAGFRWTSYDLKEVDTSLVAGGSWCVLL